MLLSLIVVPAAGAQSVPSATATARVGIQPRTCSYQVSQSQFIALQDDTVYWQGCTITLNSNLDLTGVTFTKPIGTAAIPFTSTFDGNSYTLSNPTVDISGAGTVYAGIFGVVGAGGVVKNLSLTNATILGTATSGTVYTGVVAQSAGLVDNVRFSGTVHGTATGAGTDSLAGGLVGWGSDDTVINSNVAGTVIAEGADALHAGGIAGLAQGRVIQSLSLASVQVLGTTAAVTQVHAGGLAGQMDDTARIVDSYAQGLVSAEQPTADDTAYVGGIVGEATASVLAQIDRTYYSSVATQTGSASAYVGGMAGYLADGSDLSRSYYQAGNPFGVGYAALDGSDDTALSADAMQLYASYAGTWPIVNGWQSPGANVWGICNGQGYPYLLRQVYASPCITGPTVSGVAEVGSTLEGTASASRDLAYQWGHVAGATFTPIVGQDDTTYVVQQADAGTLLALRATYDDSWIINVSTSSPISIPAPPGPPPVYPASPPTNVTAAAGDAAATITWATPISPGSFPVTTYEATASPGGASCVTAALTCEVTGLANGTAYTFVVRALNGAGWSADSAPSNPVTPSRSRTKTVTISGTRDGRRVEISGATTGLVGASVQPWLRMVGQADFTPTPSTTTVAADGTFTWGRRLAKKAIVYVVADGVTSNRVVLPAR